MLKGIILIIFLTFVAVILFLRFFLYENYLKVIDFIKEFVMFFNNIYGIMLAVVLIIFAGFIFAKLSV